MRFLWRWTSAAGRVISPRTFHIWSINCSRFRAVGSSRNFSWRASTLPTVALRVAWSAGATLDVPRFAFSKDSADALERSEEGFVAVRPATVERPVTGSDLSGDALPGVMRSSCSAVSVSTRRKMLAPYRFESELPAITALRIALNSEVARARVFSPSAVLLRSICSACARMSC